ncbi:tape measure protein [Bifidobacterium longum]|uniref:tape measure protein n=1 Tax=Bifidobacterium longum TaxID=216816 RepID=UPI001E4ABACA|nr:tape measure protein [Bifidobacterium longum]MDB6657408.1 tape measure protein [Bifidobacterium longum]MDB6665104.1 tape measure protein [Bifidobacterium longum]MDB6666422.1 tape measure protein [Bifidobacterium longum]MDB6667887.1 tape measure protein [Bifidobacterium longum]MDB6669850.1 tape measure protein [Bifidobacterium longum]
MAESSIGVVYIEVAPSGKDFGKKLEGDITQAADNAAKTGGTSILGKFGGAFGKIGKIGLGAIGTIAGGITALAAKGGFQRALAIENAQAKLKGLGHDSKSIAEIMNNALASVKGTAFGLGDAATVAATLSAAGIKSGDQMTNVLKTVADTAQISGRSLTDIGTIFSSVAARGKLQGDDMLQLMSSGVPVLQLLAKHLGKTSEEVSDMVSKGQIDFQTFADSMQEGLGGAALAAGDTFQGALANVKAALGRLGEGPGKLALESLRKAFNAAIPAIDALSGQLTPFLDKLNGQLDPYIDKAIGLIERFANGLQDGSITIQDIVGQVGQLAGAFALFAGVGGNVDKITNVFDTLGKIGDGGFGQLTGKLKQMPGQLQSSLTGLHQFKSYFNKDLRDALAVDGDPFANALNRITQGTDRLTGPFKSFGSKIAGTDIGQSVTAWGSKLTSGFGGVISKIGDSKLATGFTALAGKVKTAATPALSGLGDIFGGLGDIVGPKVQAGLGKIGGMFGSFFSPGNFLKFLGIGAIIAALVAGLGMLDQSMGGQLFVQISNLFAELPTMITDGMAKISAVLPGMIQTGSNILLALINGVTGSLPQLVSAAAQIVSMLVQGLAQALPTLLPAAVQMITTLITALIEQAPMLIQSGMQLLQGLVQGIMNSLPTLIAAIPQILQALLDTFTTALPTVLNIGVDIILNIVNGLVSAMPQLVAMLPTVIQTLISTLTSNLPGIVQVGVNALVKLIDGLSQAIPQLVGYIPQIIASIVNTLASNLPQILQAGAQIIITLAGGLAKAIPQLISQIPAIVRSIWNGFTSVNWGEVGMNIITGIASGVTSAAGKLVDAAVNAAKDALNWVKDKLGIHSPSRVFRDQVGVMIGRGMAEGIDQSQQVVNRSLDRIAAGLTLDGHSFGSPLIGGVTGGTGMLCDDRGQTATQTALLEQLLAALVALHADIPTMLQALGIELDGREVGRLVRKYANA